MPGKKIKMDTNRIFALFVLLSSEFTRVIPDRISRNSVQFHCWRPGIKGKEDALYAQIGARGFGMVFGFRNPAGHKVFTCVYRDNRYEYQCSTNRTYGDAYRGIVTHETYTELIIDSFKPERDAGLWVFYGAGFTRACNKTVVVYSDGDYMQKVIGGGGGGGSARATSVDARLLWAITTLVAMSPRSWN